MNEVPRPNGKVFTRYPIVRAKPGIYLRVTCMSRTWFGVNTHYANGRTVLCLGDLKCHCCSEGLIPRWQGYLAVLSPTSGNYGLCQITPNVLDALDECKRSDVGLVGARLCFSRASSRPNSALRVLFEGFDPSVTEYSMQELQTKLHRIFVANSMRRNGAAG
jgi:hypothetical protein